MKKLEFCYDCIHCVEGICALEYENALAETPSGEVFEAQDALCQMYTWGIDEEELDIIECDAHTTVDDLIV